MKNISFGDVSKRNLCTGGRKMFGKNKKKSEKATIVTTKEQLKAAVNRKDDCIEVRGDLAKKMKWMANLSKKKIALIVACLTGAAAAAPLTAGASMAAAGVSSANVMAIVAIVGGTAVITILNNYNIEIDVFKGVLKLMKNK